MYNVFINDLLVLLRVKTTTEAGKYVFGSVQPNDSGKTNWSATQFGGFLLYQDPRTNYIITGGFIYTINYTITILYRTATVYYFAHYNFYFILSHQRVLHCSTLSHMGVGWMAPLFFKAYISKYHLGQKFLKNMYSSPSTLSINWTTVYILWNVFRKRSL